MIKYAISVLYTIFAAINAILLYPLHVMVGRKLGKFVLRRYFRRICQINGIRIHIEGLEHIDTSEKYLIVANHQSALDIPIISGALPLDIRIFAKKELRKIPLFGLILQIYDFIYVDRENKREAIRSLKTAGELMKRYSFMIFPEGTRSKDGKLNEFKTAGISIAQKNDMPLLPVAVKDSRFAMEKGKLKVISGDVYLKIFKPFSFTPEDDRKEMATRLESMIKEFVEV